MRRYLRRSKAPESGCLSRLFPRWSRLGALDLTALPIAGLPFFRARVLVGPPLFASNPSFGLTPIKSDPPKPVHPTDKVPRRLPPPDVNGPKQSLGLPPA